MYTLIYSLRIFMATGPVGHVIGTLKFGTPTMMISHTAYPTESVVPDGKRSNLRHFLPHNSQIRAFIHCLQIIRYAFYRYQLSAWETMLYPM